MNNCVVKNYEEFKGLFVREDGTRKNGILLAFHLNRKLITLLRKEGVCTAEVSVIYSEMLTDFERIGDHLLNIAEDFSKMYPAKKA